MRQKMYFGQPINVYGTELQQRLLKAIAAAFPDWDIENPDQERHSAGYRRRVDEGGRGMDYYFEEVLPGCLAGTFLPFRDGKFGTGVYAEAKCLHDHGCLIYEIDADCRITSLLPDERRVLTVEETRKRIRNETGREPY